VNAPSLAQWPAAGQEAVGSTGHGRVFLMADRLRFPRDDGRGQE